MLGSITGANIRQLLRYNILSYKDEYPLLQIISHDHGVTRCSGMNDLLVKLHELMMKLMPVTREVETLLKDILSDFRGKLSTFLVMSKHRYWGSIGI